MKTDNILKQKVLAFALVAASALGRVFVEQSGIQRSLLLDGLLTGCLALGLFLWIGSKRMERRGRGKKEKIEE